MRYLLLLVVIVHVGCASALLGEQKLVSWCERGECSPCSSDDECVVRSNPCEESAYCAHRDADVITTALGCNGERGVPPDSRCTCQSGACRAVE